MASNYFRSSTKTRKELHDEFKKLCTYRNSWDVWADLMTATACAIANSTEKNTAQRQRREEEYTRCIERLGGVDAPAKIFALITMELECNPEQDFLGTLFMELGLGDQWKGQFFTPYSVCKAMAEINVRSINETIESKGWVSVNDCACGAGSTLIAMANTMRNQGINYQNYALFVAQDIDRVAGLMCYIQISLLGCAGYVVIADSLTNPIVGNILQPAIRDGQEFWFTPMFISDVWNYRRMFNLMDSIL